MHNLDESNGSEWCIKGKKKKCILKDDEITKPAVSVLFILVSPFIRSTYLPITGRCSQSATHLSTPVSSLQIFPP